MTLNIFSLFHTCFFLLLNQVKSKSVKRYFWKNEIKHQKYIQLKRMKKKREIKPKLENYEATLSQKPGT